MKLPSERTGLLILARVSRTRPCGLTPGLMPRMLGPMDGVEIEGGPLRALVSRYVESVALFDVELYRSVWTQDAVWDVDGRGRIHGPDAITALFVRLRSRQELAVQRLMSGRAVIRGNEGVGRWVIHSVTRTNGAGTELIGVYDDRYRCEDGTWRFVERAFAPLYRGPRELPGTVWPPPPSVPLAFS